MPLITAGGLRQYYRLNGSDDRPTLVFSHSLGCDHTMWDAQAAALEPSFRILRYDTRGHGATEAPPGEYRLEMLENDLLALVDALGIDRFALCGLSLGGMIGQRIAAHTPDRLTALILANTTSHLNDPDTLETRRQTVLRHGMSAVAETVLSRFFTAERFKTLPAVMNVRRVLRGTDPIGYAGACAALRDLSQTALLNAIRTPTLIIAGDHDVPVPWAGNGDVMVRHLPHAAVVHLPAGHLSNLECPAEFTGAMVDLFRLHSVSSE
jgi:3-oxoadipate enol-lactonase